MFKVGVNGVIACTKIVLLSSLFQFNVATGLTKKCKRREQNIL